MIRNVAAMLLLLAAMSVCTHAQPNPRYTTWTVADIRIVRVYEHSVDYQLDLRPTSYFRGRLSVIPLTEREAKRLAKARHLKNPEMLIGQPFWGDKYNPPTATILQMARTGRADSLTAPAAIFEDMLQSLGKVRCPKLGRHDFTTLRVASLEAHSQIVAPETPFLKGATNYWRSRKVSVAVLDVPGRRYNHNFPPTRPIRFNLNGKGRQVKFAIAPYGNKPFVCEQK